MKKYWRRDLGLFLPAFAAASAQIANDPVDRAQAGVSVVRDQAIEKLPVMKTKSYLYSDPPAATNGQNRHRAMFTAKTHTGSHPKQLYENVREKGDASPFLIFVSPDQQLAAVSRFSPELFARGMSRVQG